MGQAEPPHLDREALLEVVRHSRSPRRGHRAAAFLSSSRRRAVRFYLSDSASGTPSAAVTSSPPSICGHLAATDSGQELGGAPGAPATFPVPAAAISGRLGTVDSFDPSVKDSDDVGPIRSSKTPLVTTRVGEHFRSPTRRRKPVTTFSKLQRGRPIRSASVLTPRRVDFVACYQSSVVLRTGKVFGYTWTNTRTFSTSPGGSVIFFPGCYPSSLVSSGNSIDGPPPSSPPAVSPYGAGAAMMAAWLPPDPDADARASLPDGPTDSDERAWAYSPLPLDVQDATDFGGSASRATTKTAMPTPLRVVQHRMSLQSVVDRSGCAQPNLRIDWCRRLRRGTPSLSRRHQLTLSKPYFIHR